MLPIQMQFVYSFSAAVVGYIFWTPGMLHIFGDVRERESEREIIREL